MKSWLEYRDFAMNILGFSEREAEEYARKRVLEDLNRDRLRDPDYKDAA